LTRKSPQYLLTKLTILGMIASLWIVYYGRCTRVPAKGFSLKLIYRNMTVTFWPTKTSVKIGQKWQEQAWRHAVLSARCSSLTALLLARYSSESKSRYQNVIIYMQQIKHTSNGQYTFAVNYTGFHVN
jgi:hypothetical protein